MRYARIILFFVLAAVMSCYARTVQLLYLTDDKTGFFLADSRTIALLVSLFIFIVTAVAAGFSTQTRRSVRGAAKGNIYLTISSFLLSLALVYDVYFVEYQIPNRFAPLCTSLFGYISATVLIIFALSPYIRLFKQISKLIYIVLPVFFLFKLIAMFSQYATLSVVADNVIMLLALCATLMFFLFMLKLECKFLEGRNAAVFFPIAVVTSILSLVSSVPPCITLLVKDAEHLKPNQQSLVLMGAVFIFSTVYMFSVYNRRKTVIKKAGTTERLHIDQTYSQLNSQFISFVPRESEDNS